MNAADQLATAGAVEVIIPDDAHVFAIAPLATSLGLQLVSNGRNVRLVRVPPPGWHPISIEAPAAAQEPA